MAEVKRFLGLIVACVVLLAATSVAYCETQTDADNQRAAAMSAKSAAGTYYLQASSQRTLSDQQKTHLTDDANHCEGHSWTAEQEAPFRDSISEMASFIAAGDTLVSAGDADWGEGNSAVLAGDLHYTGYWMGMIWIPPDYAAACYDYNLAINHYNDAELNYEDAIDEYDYAQCNFSGSAGENAIHALHTSMGWPTSLTMWNGNWD